MEFPGVNSLKNRKTNNIGNKKRSSKKDVKVLYISSPIKVKTTASEFRALVQELTGKDSDIADTQFFQNENNHIAGGSVSSPSKSYGYGSSSCSEYSAAAFEASNDHAAAVLADDPIFGDVSFMEMLSSSSLFNDHQSYGC